MANEPQATWSSLYVRMSPRLYERVVQRADQERLTLSEWVRRLIERELERKPGA